MNRLPAAILALVLAAGCSSAGPSPAGPSPAGPSPAGEGTMELAAAQVPRLTGSPDDARLAADAVNAFGFALYRATAGNDPTNLVLSPASVAVALAMARAGARGQTATEMDAVLRDLGTDAHAAWVAALDEALGARTGTFQDLTGDPQDVTLRIVNAPFAQRGLELEPAYLDALAARFGAGLRLLDYERAPEDARHMINGWVADETKQRIPELLAQGTITDLTRLVLVNAIYLKAAWLTPFDEGATATAPFTRPGGSTVDVAMMHISDQLSYADGVGWQAVELPYVGRKLALLIIVPGDLAAFESTLDKDVLTEVAAGLSTRGVVLGLPRFGAESQLDLGAVLATLGMPTAFSDAADFSGITTQERLLIDAVIHQANIDVDEKGTEAAAATAVVMRAAGLPNDTVTLTVDRPFLFALRDVDTGAVVFLGRIANPPAAD
jgi:serpin B